MAIWERWTSRNSMQRVVEDAIERSARAKGEASYKQQARAGRGRGAGSCSCCSWSALRSYYAVAGPRPHAELTPLQRTYLCTRINTPAMHPHPHPHTTHSTQCHAVHTGRMAGPGGRWGQAHETRCSCSTPGSRPPGPISPPRPPRGSANPRRPGGGGGCRHAVPPNPKCAHLNIPPRVWLAPSPAS